MLNRRHLRIKVLQILYAYFQSEGVDALSAQKELDRSIDRIYDLYIYLLLTFEELHQVAHQKMEDRENRVRLTTDTTAGHGNLLANTVINYFIENTDLRKKSELRKINWKGDVKHNMMEKLFKAIQDGEAYRNYKEIENPDFEADKQFVLALFKTDIANSQMLYDFFEQESVYWMDDIDLVCSMVLKTIKQIEDPEKEKAILSLYKEEKEEKDFIHVLLHGTIEKEAENGVLIEELTQNWELDRIAKMDFILLKMALTELTEHSSIPKKVTLNEYIEISKFYSTPKSQMFINGILDKAIELLGKEGKLKKIGRGLID